MCVEVYQWNGCAIICLIFHATRQCYMVWRKRKQHAHVLVMITSRMPYCVTLAWTQRYAMICIWDRCGHKKTSLTHFVWIVNEIKINEYHCLWAGLFCLLLSWLLLAAAPIPTFFLSFMSIDIILRKYYIICNSIMTFLQLWYERKPFDKLRFRSEKWKFQMNESH